MNVRGVILHCYKHCSHPKLCYPSELCRRGFWLSKFNHIDHQECQTQECIITAVLPAKWSGGGQDA